MSRIDDSPFESVGPVLIAGEVADAIVAAIRATNAEVRVADAGAYVRVLVPHRCALVRHQIEEKLGHQFELPIDLENVMPSFKGQITIGEEEVVWELRGGNGK